MTSELKNPKALIFDMDGVLVDSEPLHKRAKEIAFQEAGIHFPETTYESYKGRPDATMFHEVLANKSVAEIAELLHRKHQLFEKIERELQPIPGALDYTNHLLASFSPAHFRLSRCRLPSARARLALR